MKKIISAWILFFIFSNAGAQDYRVIVPALPQFYEVTYNPQAPPGWLNFTTWSQVKVAYFDSSEVITNGTRHFTFNTWRDTNIMISGMVDCALENGPSWLGQHIDEMGNGSNYFFNANGDSILVRSNAQPGDSWDFFHLDNGKIVARLDSITFATQAGISDSAMYIALQAYDSTGAPVGNPSNGLNLVLSRSHGFFTTIAFREFPNPVLMSLREPVPMPSKADIYDFDVNDQFEYMHICYDPFFNHPPPDYQYYKILAKNFSAGLDSVIYTRQYIGLHLVYNPNPSPHLDSTITAGIDTVVYAVSANPFYTVFPEENLYPTDSSMLNNYTLREEISPSCNRFVYSSSTGYMGQFTGDTCYVLNHFEPVFYVKEYSPGLGLIKDESNLLSIAMDDCMTRLIWYNKGGQACGTFVNLVTGIESIQNSPGISVYPNPADNYCMVILPASFEGELSLNDLAGRSVKSDHVSGTSVLLDLSDLSQGVYFLTLKNKTMTYNTKVIKR